MSELVEQIGVDDASKKEYNNGDIIQFEIYKDMFGAEVPQTIYEFLDLKNTNPQKWQSLKESLCTKKALQKQLAYLHNGEHLFIPKLTQFETIVTIAGDKTNTPIRVVNTLVKSYGGTSADWNKCAGKITSSKYVFDLHWYEKDGVQYDMKLKHRKEK